MAEPIGSIIAFGGSINRASETANGWMRCDGRILDRTDPLFAPLFDAIAFTWGGDGDTQFNIPDLRGYFLRGLDRPDQGRDPDGATREANNKGGATGKSVGSIQGFATALPVTKFEISTHGSIGMG